jgi:hypothetical protein
MMRFVFFPLARSLALYCTHSLCPKRTKPVYLQLSTSAYFCPPDTKKGRTRFANGPANLNCATFYAAAAASGTMFVAAGTAPKLTRAAMSVECSSRKCP